jgi:hypothetical protein
MLRCRLVQFDTWHNFVSQLLCYRFAETTANELTHSDVLLLKRALCRRPPPPTR